ncbi:MAG: ABC transporter [Nautilia sp.]|nr:MAG: ABC transporter [Nautilia sp.]
MNIIEIKNVTFSYNGEKVLKNINLIVKKGDYLAVIGPNGGGKSTLIKLMLGLLKPTKGKITLHTSKIGYVPQYTNFSLDIPISVLDVVLQGRIKKYKFFYNEEDKKEALEKLKIVKMFEYKDKKISDLSGGQRQRVLIARAMVSNPDILILDEPTSAIDVQGQKEIYDILKELKITKIMISHDLNFLLEGVNKVAWVNKTLVLHDAPDLHLHRKDGHFCEIDFINEVHKCKVCND